MTTAKFEIFSAANGRVIESLYGRANAVMRAKYCAEKHQTTVGLSCGEGETQYFSPSVSKYYKPEDSNKVDYHSSAESCLYDLTKAISEFPEIADEYGNQAYGIFSMWLKVSGFSDYEENDEIAAMREKCEYVSKLGFDTFMKVKNG